MYFLLRRSVIVRLYMFSVESRMHSFLCTFLFFFPWKRKFFSGRYFRCGNFVMWNGSFWSVGYVESIIASMILLCRQTCKMVFLRAWYSGYLQGALQRVFWHNYDKDTFILTSGSLLGQKVTLRLIDIALTIAGIPKLIHRYIRYFIPKAVSIRGTNRRSPINFTIHWQRLSDDLWVGVCILEKVWAWRIEM